MPPLTHALLLTAGLGTRLRPLTDVRAKPAIPVAGVPMVARIMTWLRDAGLTEVVLNLHHLPTSIAAIVGDGSACGVRARYSWEHPEVLGSAGGPRQALDIIGADTFVIVNGDTLTNLALPPLLDAHAASGALVTMAVVPNRLPQHYSGLRVDADGAVLGVVPRGSSEASYHFVGVQVTHREAFAGAPPGRPSNSVGDVYTRLVAARPGSVRVHVCDAGFWDIGTVADYWHTSHAFAHAEGVDLNAGAQLEGEARVSASIVWDDVRVGPGASIDHCIVTDGVRVGAGARFTRQILMRGPDDQVVTVPLSVEQS